jgi:hypothetical protein
VAQTRSVLYVIRGGGPPAKQLADFVCFAQEQGWDVCVIATPDGGQVHRRRPADRADRASGAGALQRP